MACDWCYQIRRCPTNSSYMYPWILFFSFLFLVNIQIHAIDTGHEPSTPTPTPIPSHKQHKQSPPLSLSLSLDPALLVEKKKDIIVLKARCIWTRSCCRCKIHKCRAPCPFTYLKIVCQIIPNDACARAMRKRWSSHKGNVRKQVCELTFKESTSVKSNIHDPDTHV